MSSARFVGVVPCAGVSQRMGRSKALLDAAGKPFLARVVTTLREGGCGRVLVVVRDHAGPEADLARSLGANVLVNEDPSDGPISSVRTAIEALEGEAVRLHGIALLHVDHPLVDPATLRTLLTAALDSQATDVIAVPTWDGRRGHPVVFGADTWPELLDPALEGGARTVVRRDASRVLEVTVDDPGILADIDDAQAYEAFFGRADAAGPVGGFDGVDDIDSPRDVDVEPLGAAEAAHAILEATRSGRSVVQLVSLDAVPLRRLAFSRSPDALGSLGSPEVDAAADTLARDLQSGTVDPGRHTLAGVPVFAEIHRPHPELVIVGAGHIAQPLCSVGALLGFRVVVADDRPEFATGERFPEAAAVIPVDFSDPFREIPLHESSHLVLVTRGHKYDYECLRRVLLSETRPSYLGMIGSRRRVRATFQQLLDEGIPRARLEEIRAPLGLDLGAETPAEIAVAVAGELVQSWRGGSGIPLRDKERILERHFGDGRD